MTTAQRTSTIFPDSQKPAYGNGVENIDFTIRLSPGQALLKNSMRLTGNVVFYQAGTTVFPVGSPALYDYKLGVHSLFRSMYVNTTNNGTISNINEYPEWVKLYRQRDGDRQSYCGSAVRELELSLPDLRSPSNLISNEEGTNFSMYPLIPLNLCDPDSGNLTNRSGDIMLTLTTNNPLSVLYGVESSSPDGTQTILNPVTSNSGYEIRNLKLHYDVVGATPADTQTNVMTIFGSRHTVLSNNDTFSVNLPIVATGFVGAYRKITSINTANTNEYKFLNPDITRLEFTYNNTTNEVISFPLRSQEEIVLNSLSALELGTKSSVTLGQLSIGDSDEFSIGLPFGTPLDLSKARLAIRTECNGITNTDRALLDVFCVGKLGL